MNREPAEPKNNRSGRARAGARYLALGLAGSISTAAVGAPQPAATRPPRPPAAKSGPPVVAPPRRPPETISINFPNVEIRQALATVAAYAQTDVLITPGATGSVTINLRNRPPDEVIRLVAASAGLTVLKNGTTYVVGPALEVRRTAAQLGRSVVVPLTSISAADAVETLARVAPTVNVEPAGKAVVLSGLSQDLETAQAALRALDIRPPVAPPQPERTSTDVASVRYVDPVEVARVLKEAFPELRISRQERTLILTGTETELDGVSRALKALDVEPPVAAIAPEVRETVVVALSYLNAKLAEESLKKAFPSLIAVAAPEPTAPPAALFQPLSTGFLGGNGNNGGGLSGGGSGGGGFGGAGGGGGGSRSTGNNSGGGAGGGQNGYEQQLSRSTRMILSGFKSEVESARKLLAEVDVAPPRVNIEAELIELTDVNTNELGIRWGLDNATAGFKLGGRMGVRVGSITESGFQLEASLQALLLTNRAKILARPNISAIDNEDASIFIGNLVRFRGINVVSPTVGTVQGTETVPVGIALLVRPRIHLDGSVTLKVHPVISNVSETVDGLPQTSSREADTTVRLAAGEALVIGGLQQDEDSDQLRRVPGLSNLPLVGGLFRTRSRRRGKTEIVVIVRATRIVDAPTEVKK